MSFVENDRVTRLKRGWRQSPATAIHRALNLAEIGIDDVDAVAVGWDIPIFPDYVGEAAGPDEPQVFYEWLLDPNEEIETVRGRDRRRHPSRTWPHRLPPIHFVPHHMAHAAASMWTSGFEKSAVVVADGRGELHSTSVGYGDIEKVQLVKTWDISQSLGHFFNVASEFVGLDFWDVGKLMGLAAYGQPTQPMPIRIDEVGYQFTGVGEPGPQVSKRLKQQRAALEMHFSENCYPYQHGDGRETPAFANFAASVQAALDEAMLALSTAARDLADSGKLVIGGGVGLNCSMIGALWRSGKFDDIHVPPFTYDGGVGLGAALVVLRDSAPEQWEPRPRVRDVYWGCDIDKQVGAEIASQHGLHIRRVDAQQLASEVAQRIHDGELIGWAQGRAEVGQRALGARSIIGDARDRTNLLRINELKGRESWRPLAPSVHEDHAASLFVGELPAAAQFMLAACPVRDEAARTIPACTHVDMSARPQVVSRSLTPNYFDVIEAYRQLTGVPAIVNTSFNLAGEPIVNDGRDAVDTFVRCDLDALVLDDLIITKSIPLHPKDE